MPWKAALETLWTPETLDAPHAVPDKARRVRAMFNAIAPRYEMVNSVCSAGRDSYWRRKAVELCDVEARDIVLDVACGTGDFTRAFASAGVRFAVGCDFAHAMLVRANGASERAGGRKAPGPGGGRRTCRRLCEADATCLPFRGGSFTIVSCAFGVRNFQDLDGGLREMRRVLRSGGRAVILEFSRPANRWLRRFYEFYAARVMPRTASWLSGDRSGAYRYLPQSVVSFLTAKDMCARLSQAGFVRVDATPLTFGVVTVYVARCGPRGA